MQLALRIYMIVPKGLGNRYHHYIPARELLWQRRKASDGRVDGLYASGYDLARAGARWSESLSKLWDFNVL